MQKSPRGIPLTSLLGPDGHEVGASFCVEQHPVGFGIHFASRSGASGSPGERNPEYTRGLELLLRRLTAANVVLVDAILDSRRYLQVSEDDRRLRLAEEFTTPLALRAGIDAAALRSALTSAQGGLLTKAEGTHGNTTRAIALRVSNVPPSIADRAQLEQYLRTGQSPVPYPLAVQEDDLPQPPAYVPSSDDNRDRAFRSIVQRRGQPKFRKSLLARFGGRCVVTGCDLMDVLEAAHIDPYRGSASNAPDNGLLLRADIHTLYDLDLIGIDPDTLVVHLKRTAAEAGYATLSGRTLEFSRSQKPSDAALRKRWEDFQARS